MKKKILQQNRQIVKLRLKNQQLIKSQRLHLCYKNIRNDSVKLLFYTGLNSKELFCFILELLESQPKAVSNVTREDHLLIVLMKLRLGIFNKDIAFRFDCNKSVITKIIHLWLPALANALEYLIIWPGKSALMENLPKSFKSFKKCTGIIDCTEIFIQKPSGLEQKAVTWSSYKNTNTIKYLICITPSGNISFVSEG